jgi:hypothetical protein
MKCVPGIWCTVFSAALAVSAPNPLAGQQGQIVGRVVDAETRLPVTGAGVFLTGTRYQTASDTLGFFRLSNVPAARYRLEVSHIAYSSHTVDVVILAGAMRAISIAISATAIQLDSVTVEALTAAERRERGSGYRRSIVTREEIERAQNTNLEFGDLLRIAAPTVSVRRLQRVGSPVCIELRTVRGMSGRCNSPAVYMDGVPINDPTHLYDNFDLKTLESLEVVPVAEAGVMYGTGALYGAILITTRRPGALSSDQARKNLATRPTSFHWSQEAQRHSTTRVFATSVLGNGLGLALGVSAARQCIGLRKPAYDGIISDCKVATTLGTGAAAVVLPAVASSLASRWSGRTERSQGEIVPAAVGTAMAIVPGYALVFSGYRNDSDALKWVGYGVIVVGAPLLTTAADYLFRELRGKSEDKK